MEDKYPVPKEQKKLLEAVEAVNVAYLLSGEEDQLSVSFHNQAINNTPGWNVFLKNIRFEFGYQQSKMRFSLSPDENNFIKFKDFLDNELNVTEYEVTHRLGIKYIVEIDLEKYIYTEDGVQKIALITSKILENS